MPGLVRIPPRNRGRREAAARVEHQGAARGDRCIHRFEPPAAHRIDRLPIEGPRRLGAQHARIGDAAIGTDGELHQHLAGGTRTQGVGREPRCRRADRTQAARDRSCGGRGGGTGFGRLARRRLALLGFAPDRRLAGGFLLLGQQPGSRFGLGLGGQCGLLRGLLLGQHPRLGLGLGPGRGLFAALGHRLLAGHDALADTRQRRRTGVGLVDQGRKPLRLVELLARHGLLGGDDGVGHQVGQRTGNTGIVGQLVAQGQVVLHGVVARRRVHPILTQGLGRAFAQLVHAHRLHVGGHHRGRRAGGGRGRRSRRAFAGGGRRGGRRRCRWFGPGTGGQCDRQQQAGAQPRTGRNVLAQHW